MHTYVPDSYKWLIYSTYKSALRPFLSGSAQGQQCFSQSDLFFRRRKQEQRKNPTCLQLPDIHILLQTRSFTPGFMPKTPLSEVVIERAPRVCPWAGRWVVSSVHVRTWPRLRGYQRTLRLTTGCEWPCFGACGHLDDVSVAFTSSVVSIRLVGR